MKNMTNDAEDSDEYDNENLTDDPSKYDTDDDNDDNNNEEDDDETSIFEELPPRRKNNNNDVSSSHHRRLRSSMNSSVNNKKIKQENKNNTRFTRKNYTEYDDTDDDDTDDEDEVNTFKTTSRIGNNNNNNNNNKRKRSDNTTKTNPNPTMIRRKRTAIKTASSGFVIKSSSSSSSKKNRNTSSSVSVRIEPRRDKRGRDDNVSKYNNNNNNNRYQRSSSYRTTTTKKYRTSIGNNSIRSSSSRNNNSKPNRNRSNGKRHYNSDNYIPYRDDDQHIKFHWEESSDDEDNNEDASSNNNYHSESEEIEEEEQEEERYDNKNNKRYRRSLSVSSKTSSKLRKRDDDKVVVVANNKSLSLSSSLPPRPPNLGSSILLIKSTNTSHEKQFVTLQKRKGTATSPVWTYDYFRTASVMEDWESHVTGSDKDEYKGLVKIVKAKGACVCMICYRNPKKTLSQCVVSTNEKYTPSNLFRHLKLLHLEQYTEIAGEKKKTIISKEDIIDLNLDEDIGIYEKQFVTLTKREGSVKSPIWTNDYFRLATLPEDWETRIAGQDKSIYHGLAKVAKSKGPFACMLCFNDKNKALDDCVFATNEDRNSSNLMRHLKHAHPDHYEAIMGDRKPAAVEEIDVTVDPSSYEKQFVSLEKREGLVKSPVWTCDYFRKASLKENWESEIAGEDKTVYKGLAKVAKAKGPCVCMLCFRNKDKDLEQCIVSTNEDYNASNLMRHLKHNHTDHYNKIILDKEPAPDAKKTYNEIIDIGSYEKQLVTLEKREGSVSSPVWTSGYFCLVSIIRDWEIHIDGADFSRYKGLVKVGKAKGPCVCMLCFRDKDKDLEQCVLSTNENFNASNLMRHLKHSHPDQFFEITSGKEPADQPPVDTIKNENERTVDANDSYHRDNNNNMMIEEEQDYNQMNPKVALEVWERKVYSFFNKCRIPARFASSPEFKELMSFTVRNAPSLKPNITKFIADMRNIHRLPSQH